MRKRPEDKHCIPDESVTLALALECCLDAATTINAVLSDDCDDELVDMNEAPHADSAPVARPSFGKRRTSA
jgi:hypothetical protein